MKDHSRITHSRRQDAPSMNLFGLSLVFMTPMLLGFLYGFDIGATSFVLSMLLEDQTTTSTTNKKKHASKQQHAPFVWWQDMGSLQQGLFVSALSLGALLGSHLVLMSFSQRIGRRLELRMCSILYLVGTAWNVAAGTWLKSSVLGFYSLLLGRIIFGIGVAFVMHGAPAYVAEMCPPQIRGAGVSAKETVIVTGMVLGYVTRNMVSQTSPRWTDLYALSVVIAFPMFLMTFYIPRSKRWLLLQGLRDEAYGSMQFVYKGNVRDAFEQLEAQIREVSSTNTTPQESLSIASLLFSPQNESAMTASMGLILFQQMSGKPSVLSYTTVLFEAAGWGGNASVVTALLVLAMSISTVLIVDRVGRKPLLRVCCGTMMIASFLLGACFFWFDKSSETELEGLPRIIVLVAMCVYIGGYQVGFGPVTWLIVSEIFPLEIRGKAIALGMEWNYLLNFIVQFTFPIVQDTLGWGPLFGLFGFILMVAFGFVQRFVPETKGLTLEEIQIKFSI